MKKTILITGASSGFGKAIADHLLAAGHTVIGTSRHAPSDGPIAAVGLTMVQLDVCDVASVAALGHRLKRAGYMPTLVILNAGYGISGAIEETLPADIVAQFDTNLVGTHRVVREFLPSMRAAKHGQLIFIGSLGAHLTMPFQGIYSASKAALASYVEALRMELLVFGINVSMIDPGDHRTGFTDQRQQYNREGYSAYEPQMTRALDAMAASERAGADPVDIARVVAKIASTRKPRVRYLGISTMERIFLLFRRILPWAWYEQMLCKAFKIT